jgi:hypothetical protein
VSIKEEGRELSYTQVVLERHSVEQVKELVSFLIEYIKDDVSIEKWEEQSPERTVRLVKVMLKNRDKVTCQRGGGRIH